MLDQARYDALMRLKEHARNLGANAAIGARFDSSAIGQAMSEILAYETAVVVQKDDSPRQPVSLG